MIEYTKEKLEKVVKKSETYRQVLLEFNRNLSSASYRILKNNLNKWNISTNHFLSPSEVMKKLQKEGKMIKYSDEDIFIKNSSVGRSTLKKAFLKKVKNICLFCGQDENWNDMKISLILDHINGINNDNRFENLRLLCPNCNAGIPTHCKGSVGLLKKNKIDKRNSYKGIPKLNQRKVERPKYETLIKEVGNLGYTGTGKKYGVSDNSIRKWIKFYEEQNASMV